MKPTQPTQLDLMPQRVQRAAASQQTPNALTLARPTKPGAATSDTTPNEPRTQANPPRRFNALAMPRPKR